MRVRKNGSRGRAKANDILVFTLETTPPPSPSLYFYCPLRDMLSPQTVTKWLKIGTVSLMNNHLTSVYDEDMSHFLVRPLSNLCPCTTPTPHHLFSAMPRRGLVTTTFILFSNKFFVYVGNKVKIWKLNFSRFHLTLYTPQLAWFTYDWTKEFVMLL